MHTNPTAINTFRSPVFDHFFIGFIPVLAIVSAYVAAISPQHFEVVFFLDVMLLGYHHVISTYTRMAFSPLSLKEHRFLIFVLPFLVIAFVVGCAKIGSIWLISTVYLHWQWWHYSRQSEGIAKAISMKTKSTLAGGITFNRVMFYLVPIACFLSTSARQEPTFLFMPVYTLPIPVIVAQAMLAATGAAWLIWFGYQLKALKQKQISLPHFSYLLSHHVIYLVAYVLIKDITIGWLVINIWHNLQYITFVWHFNNSKFKAGVDKTHLVISWLSQKKHIAIYFGFCLIMTYLFYSLVNSGVSLLSPYSSLPLMVIAYQSINFHHYVVDSLIWKMRKPSMQKSLGIK